MRTMLTNDTNETRTLASLEVGPGLLLQPGLRLRLRLELGLALGLRPEWQRNICCDIH